MWLVKGEKQIWIKQTLAKERNKLKHEFDDTNWSTAGATNQANPFNARLVHVNIPIGPHSNDSQY